MSQEPNHSSTLSLKLSEVLGDIGVTEEMVQKRRKMFLLVESMWTTRYRLLDDNMSMFMFGSQSEGATTLGLDSDVDTLKCDFKLNVIQDWSERQPGTTNLLMIQNETTSPGYCLLQILRKDEHLPLSISISEHMLPPLTVGKGNKVLVKNTHHDKVNNQGVVINGPAASKQGNRGFFDGDLVKAYHCKTWPIEAQNWLATGSVGGWPSEKMKRDCETTGCFVVPVSSKSGRNQDTEWRISTSQAERCLMFSLNITQIRCYILMKMILKTFINPQCDDVLSSFMCKTVLFHCIQNTNSAKWHEHNLLEWLNCCLLKLQTCVRHENCPHFIINRNNLMAGKISSSNKNKLLDILELIIQSEGQKLLEISIDSLGLRLQGKRNMLPDGVIPTYPPPDKLNGILSTLLLINFAKSTSVTQNILFKKLMSGENKMVQQKLSDALSRLDRIRLNYEKKSTCKNFKMLLCSLLGSTIASHDIYTNRTLSQKALVWFSASSLSDVSSGRLKLASALYCAVDISRTEIVLKNTEDLYDLQTVEPVCGCRNSPRSHFRPGFCDKSKTSNEELTNHVTAFCVTFFQCEINCVPKELQYEMFRSTQEVMPDRDEDSDIWMDSAVVDSLPYLYFLQYKTYRHLQRAAEQHQALKNLATSIDTEPNLGHMETALNLLGQCMEQENRHKDALHYYMKSLNVRARNNVAKIHICRLLFELVKKSVES